MKKTLFLLLSFLILFSCKKKDDSEDKTTTAQWENTNCPASTIRSMAASGSIVIVGADDGISGDSGDGAFISTNNGSTWTKVNNGFAIIDGYAHYFLRSLVINGGKIFAGLAGGGIYTSTNNGASWTEVNSGIPDYTTVYSFAFSGSKVFAGPQSDGIAYNNTVIYVSNNNGASWSAVTTDLPQDESIYSLAINGSNIFAGVGDNGVYLSTNNGVNWTAVNNGINTGASIFSFVICGSNIYAGSPSYGTYLSNNNGASWTSLYGSGGANSLIYDGSNIYSGGSSGLYKYTGTNWSYVNFSGKVITSLAIGGGYIYVGLLYDGVWRYPL